MQLGGEAAPGVARESSLRYNFVINAMNEAVKTSDELCYSIRLLRPFWAPLLPTPIGSTSLMKQLLELSDDARIPVSTALQWLDLLVQLMGDPYMGLHAVARVQPGTGDILEFAARSAATLGDALSLVVRYVRMLNEAAEYTIATRESVVTVELHSKVKLSRNAADFQMGTLVAGIRTWLGTLENFEVWFEHEEPEDLSAYREVFGDAQLRFGAQYDTLILNAALLDAPLVFTDEALHKFLVRQADQLIAQVPHEDTLASKVRKVLLELLPSGNADAERISAKLGMSRRSLTRRLDHEGLSFKELLDQTRHHMALQYLEKTQLDPQQIAFLLGYSVTTAFSRAFARWEGKSPTEHRRARREGK